MPDRIAGTPDLVRLLDLSPQSAIPLAAKWPKDIRRIAAYLDGVVPSREPDVHHG